MMPLMRGENQPCLNNYRLSVASFRVLSDHNGHVEWRLDKAKGGGVGRKPEKPKVGTKGSWGTRGTIKSVGGLD